MNLLTINAPWSSLQAGNIHIDAENICLVFRLQKAENSLGNANDCGIKVRMPYILDLLLSLFKGLM